MVPADGSNQEGDHLNKYPYGKGRADRDLKRMLKPIDWPGCIWAPCINAQGRTFGLKRWNGKQLELACLEYHEGTYRLYSELGKLLDEGGVKVPMQAIDNGWVSD
jgi:hypothetical protein